MRKTRLIAVVKVAVQIDETGSDEPAGNVDGFARALRRNIFRESGNLAVCEGDVTPAAEILTGVDDFTVLEQEIVFIFHARPFHSIGS
jgi:hypothetical protein